MLFALKSPEGHSWEPWVWGPGQVVDTGPNSTQLCSYQWMVTLWALCTGKRNRVVHAGEQLVLKMLKGKREARIL